VVCVVSHDRYFLNRVCTDILAFEGDGRIHHSAGDYDYYLEKKQRTAAAATIVSINKSAALSRPAAPKPQRRPNRANFPSKKPVNWKAWSHKSRDG